MLASAWWVKGALVVGLAAACDLCRKRLPAAAACAGASLGLAGLVVHVLKEAFDRLRPPLADPAITAIGSIPSDPSFPSGHTATAFATAAAAGPFFPRLRWPLFGLAALVGTSRMYLGVHFASDVLVGALVGVVVGLGVAWAARRLGATLRAAVTPA